MVISSLILVTFLSGAFGLFYAHKHFFVIRSITCTTTSLPCPTQISEQMGAYLGQSILLLDKKNLKKEIATLIAVDDISISLNLPSQVNIQLSLATFQLPLTIINSNEANFSYSSGLNLSLANFFKILPPPQYLLLPKGQIVISSSSQPPLSLATTASHPQEDLASLSQFIKVISSQSRFSFQGIVLDNNNNLLILTNKGQVIICSLAKPASEVLSALQQISTTATIKQSTIIDLRFNNPLIK